MCHNLDWKEFHLYHIFNVTPGVTTLPQIKWIKFKCGVQDKVCFSWVQALWYDKRANVTGFTKRGLRR